MGQPDFELKREIVERSQNSPVCRLRDGRLLHGVALGDDSFCGYSDRQQQGLQGFAEPPNQGPTFLGGDHDRKQSSFTDGEHYLCPSGADYVGIPVAKNRVRRRRLWCRYGIESGEKLLGAAKREHDGDTAVNPGSSIRHKGRSPDTSLYQGFSIWLLDLGSNQGPTD